MIAIIACSLIALLSILFLIGWFFSTIETAQQRIDKEGEL
jgi:ABC-type Na+ efflux pump permease subunit